MRIHIGTALTAVLALTVGLPNPADAQIEPPTRKDLGQIKIEITATRQEMGQVMSIAQRLGGKLQRDNAFVEELARAADQGSQDELQEIVAKAAGVGKAMVHMGGSGRRVGSARPSTSRLLEAGSDARTGGPSADANGAPRPLSPWSVKYTMLGNSWCIAPGIAFCQM